jgi:hypothetical protein
LRARFFKGAYPAAYRYADVDVTSTFTCTVAGSGYDVVFCPGTSKYPSGLHGLGTFRFLLGLGCATRMALLHPFGILLVPFNIPNVHVDLPCYAQLLVKSKVNIF